MSGWSNTNYRGGNNGYVPGCDNNNSFNAPSSGFAGTTNRSSFDTFNDPFNHSTVTPGFNSGFSGTTHRTSDTFNDPFNHSVVDHGHNSHHHSSGPSLGKFFFSFCVH